MVEVAEKPKRKRKTKTLRLDLGCGQRCSEGFEGVDLHPADGVKHVVDLFGDTQWPFKTSSVDEIFSSHLVEHIPHGDGDVDGFYKFFNEVHRICKPDAKVVILTPYGKSNRALQDPTHRRSIVPETWNYLNQDWLKGNGIDHYTGFTGDFEIVVVYGNGPNQRLVGRNDAYIDEAQDFYWNSFADLAVELKVKK